MGVNHNEAVCGVNSRRHQAAVTRKSIQYSKFKVCHTTSCDTKLPLGLTPQKAGTRGGLRLGPQPKINAATENQCSQHTV